MLSNSSTNWLHIAATTIRVDAPFSERHRYLDRSMIRRRDNRPKPSAEHQVQPKSCAIAQPKPEGHPNHTSAATYERVLLRPPGVKTRKAHNNIPYGQKIR